MKNIKLFIGVFIIVFILTFILLLAFNSKPQQAEAVSTNLICKHLNAECQVNQSGNNCCGSLTCVPFNVHSSNGKCGTAPSATPTPTLTDTPAPTVTPCVVWEGEFPQPCPTVTPTPSATPSVTPNVEVHSSDGLSSDPGATQASSPTCNVSFQAPVLQGFKALGNGSVEFSWWPVKDVDRYSIIYGYTSGNLVYGQDYIAPDQTSVVINGLKVGSSVFARVYAWRGQCPSISNELDPIVK